MTLVSKVTFNTVTINAYQAVADGDRGNVRTCIREGVSVNKVNDQGKNLLQLAAEANNQSVARLLVDKGAVLRIGDKASEWYQRLSSEVQEILGAASEVDEDQFTLESIQPKPLALTSSKYQDAIVREGLETVFSKSPEKIDTLLRAYLSYLFEVDPNVAFKALEQASHRYEVAMALADLFLERDRPDLAENLLGCLANPELKVWINQALELYNKGAADQPGGLVRLASTREKEYTDTDLRYFYEPIKRYKEMNYFFEDTSLKWIDIAGVIYVKHLGRLLLAEQFYDQKKYDKALEQVATIVKERKLTAVPGEMKTDQEISLATRFQELIDSKLEKCVTEDQQDCIQMFKHYFGLIRSLAQVKSSRKA